MKCYTAVKLCFRWISTAMLSIISTDLDGGDVGLSLTYAPQVYYFNGYNF